MTEQYIQHNQLHNRRNAQRIFGALAITAALTSCATSELAPQSTIVTASPRATADTPLSLNTAPAKPNQTTESLPSMPSLSSEQLPQQTINVANLFNAGKHAIQAYDISVKDGIPDLTPPLTNDIYYSYFATKEGDIFDKSLTVDADGNVKGNVFIGGHTNSKGEWVMNGIQDAKIGDVQKLYADGTEYDVIITSRTLLDKKGDKHLVANFGDALGDNGAIFGCLVITDKNGKSYQSGKVIILGIHITKAS